MSVYFIESGPYMKIGYSANPIQRNGTVTRNGARPADLPFKAKTDLFGWIPGDRKAERRMHERFANVRVAGEWFWSERKQADEIIWADPRGIHIHRMSAQAVFAMLREPAWTRDDVEAHGIQVLAVPETEALENMWSEAAWTSWMQKSASWIGQS